MPIQLMGLPLGPDAKKTLVGFLREKFRFGVQARTDQIESDLTRWMENYAGKPQQETRTTPFLHASNFVPQLIRMHTDILVARLYGLMVAAKPFWHPSCLMEEMPHETLEGVSSWMEFISFFQLHLPDVLDQCLRRVCKTGLLMLKGPWKQDIVWTADGPTDDGRGIKTSSTTDEYLQLQPMPFDDVWIWPITVNDPCEAKIIFHRLRLTKEDVQARIASGAWDKTQADKILLSDPKITDKDAPRQAQAAEAGIMLTADVDRPYTVIEAHLRYEVQPGKPFKIIVTFNPHDESNDGYLRGYFSPYKKIENCFTSLNLLPREDLVYGYSIPEILEQFQEEQAQIHNGRRDTATIANVPGWKKKRDPLVPNPATEWYPGKVFELEDMADIEMLTFGGQYNDMITEEGFLLQLAERTTGISPPMQGAGVGGLNGQRGIYSSQGTMALLAEGNQRIDIYLRRMRFPMHNIGNLIYQSYRTFKPEGAEYRTWGKYGQAVKQSFNFKEPEGYPGFFFEMSASTGSVNKESDRTALLLMANTMSAYYRQLVEAVSSMAQIPDGHPLKATLMLVLDGAKDLADRLLFAFDIGDRKRLVPDVRTAFGGSPQAGAEQADSLGMPTAEGDVPIDGIQTLSNSIGALQAQGATGSSNGRGSQ